MSSRKNLLADPKFVALQQGVRLGGLPDHVLEAVKLSGWTGKKTCGIYGPNPDGDMLSGTWKQEHVCVDGISFNIFTGKPVLDDDGEVITCVACRGEGKKSAFDWARRLAWTMKTGDNTKGLKNLKKVNEAFDVQKGDNGYLFIVRKGETLDSKADSGSVDGFMG